MNVFTKCLIAASFVFILLTHFLPPGLALLVMLFPGICLLAREYFRRFYNRSKEVVLTASPNDGSLSIGDLVEALPEKPEMSKEAEQELSKVRIKIQFIVTKKETEQ